MLSDKLRIASNTGAKSKYIVVAISASPYIVVYPITSTGLGAKFANPTTLPAGVPNSVDAHPDGNAIVVAHNTSPYVTAYVWSKNGFGNKYSNPVTLPTASANKVKFNPSGTAVAIAHYNSPYVSVYRWSTAGFGTKFADPSILLPDVAWDIAFSPDNTAIAIGHNSSPYVTAYQWSSSGFGSKFTNPGTLPQGAGYSVSFNPLTTALIVGNTPQGVAPRLSMTAYAWSSSGFGVNLSNPIESTFTCDSFKINKFGDKVYRTDSTALRSMDFSTSSGFSNALTFGGSWNIGTLLGLDIDINNSLLAGVGNTSPYLKIFRISGALFTQPSTPADIATPRSVKFLEI